MIRTLLVASFALAAAQAAAATLTVPGIPSFDTSLGTLLSATVTIDPPTTMTSEHTPGLFESIDNHNHIVSPFPVLVSGLGSFSFPPTPTNFVDPGLGDSHTHFVNLPPSVQMFGGASLAWFLDPANGLATVNLVVPPTTTNEDHNHTVNFLPVVPSTQFAYLPVPEPSSFLLAATALAGTLIRRR